MSSSVNVKFHSKFDSILFWQIQLIDQLFLSIEWIWSGLSFASLKPVLHEFKDILHKLRPFWCIWRIFKQQSIASMELLRELCLIQIEHSLLSDGGCQASCYCTWPHLIFVMFLINRNFRPTSSCDSFDKYELPLLDQSHNRRLLGGPIQQEKKCLALVT